MKKILFYSLLLFYSTTSFAQFTGNKSVPGDYALLQAAMAGLNAQDVGTGGGTDPSSRGIEATSKTVSDPNISFGNENSFQTLTEKTTQTSTNDFASLTEIDYQKKIETTSMPLHELYAQSLPPAAQYGSLNKNSAYAEVNLSEEKNSIENLSSPRTSESKHSIPAPLAAPSTATTNEATNITTTGATLNGTVVDNGIPATVTFEYGLDDTYGTVVTAAESPVTGGVSTPVSAVISGLVPNTTYHFRVVAEDTDGTTSGLDQTFTTACPIIIATISGEDTLCANSTAVVFSTESGQSNYVWSVIGDATIVSGDGNESITVDFGAAGNDTISVTYVDENGCAPAEPVQFAVVINPLPVATISGEDTLCANSTAVVFSTESGQSNYVWSVIGDATIVSGDGTESITVDFGAAGNDTLSVTYLDENGCAPAEPVQFAVVINPLPVATISGEDTLCANSTAVVFSTESGQSNYVWSVIGDATIVSGDGTESITVDFGAAGNDTLSVTYVDENGCSPLEPVLFPILVNPLPLATIAGEDTLCANSTGLVFSTESGQSNYVWSVIGDATIVSGDATESITVDFGAAGNDTLSVTYVDENGCSPLEPVLFPILVNPLPLATIAGEDTLCANSSGIVFSTESGQSNYVWSVIGDATIVSGDGTESITVDFGAAGNDTLSVTYVDENGCSPLEPAQFAILVSPIPVATISGEDTLCANSTGLVFTTESGQSNYVWSVIGDATIVSGDGTESITVDFGAAGNDTISVTYVDENGCSPLEPAQFAILVNPIPLATISGEDTLCANSSGLVFTTESGQSNYVWSVIGDATIVSGDGTESITVDFGAAGNDTLSVTYVDENGCSPLEPAQFAILVSPIPVATITGEDTLCANSSGLVFTTESGQSNYVWSVTGDATIVSGDGTESITVDFGAAGNDTLSVTYVDENGCSPAEPVLFAILVNPLPIPVISGENSICENSTGIVFSTESGQSNYVWSVIGDATIVSGDGTESITVDFGAAGNDTLSVTYVDENGCVPLEPTQFAILVNPLPVATITGEDTLCANSTAVVFSTESGQANYVWSIIGDATLVSGDGTESITVDFGAAGNDTLSVTYVDENGCSPLVPDQLAVLVNPLPVPVISGEDSLCENATGIVYTTESGQSNYVWSVAGDASIVSGDGTESITVDFGAAGNDTISVTYTDENGCSPLVPAQFAVIVAPTLTTAGEISGPDSIDIPSTGNVYSVSPLAGATTYTWTVLSGGTITSGQGTSSITVDFPASTVLGSISVIASNACSETEASSLEISINAPVAAGLIFSPTNSSQVCIGSSGHVYSVDPILNAASYVWSVPEGAIIDNGQGTPSISVSYPEGSVSGDVTVYGVNSSGNGAPSSFAVGVNVLPNAPTITGNTDVCQQAYEIYETEDSMTNYDWEVTGGLIVFNTGNRVTVWWQESGLQSISVTYANAGGCTATIPTTVAVTVRGLPISAGPVVGESKVCTPAEGIAFSTQPIFEATSYEWILPDGATIVSGAGTNQIVVDFAANAQSGSILVRGVNSCGEGGFSLPFVLEASATPEPPLIYINDEGLLVTNLTAGTFQWYLNGSPLLGATNPTLAALVSGLYHLIVIVNGCESAPSNIVGVTVGVTDKPVYTRINLYPVPNTGKFTVSFDSQKQETYTIRILSAIGAQVYKSESIVVNGKFDKQITLPSDIPAGVYTVRIEGSGGEFTKKMIITK